METNWRAELTMQTAKSTRAVHPLRHSGGWCLGEELMGAQDPGIPEIVDVAAR